MADNTIALGIRPPAPQDYNALTMQRANMMQGFAEQDAARQQTANAMLRQQTQDARQVQQDQIAAQDRQMRMDVDARKLQETQAAAQQAQAKAQILNGARSLLYAPLEQRVARFNAEIAPMLREMNVPEEVLAAAAADDALSNAEINQFIALFGGETVDPKNTALGNRMVQEDPITGAVKEVFGAPPPNPLADELMRSQIGATQALEAQRRRPAASGGGGGSSGGGGGGGGAVAGAAPKPGTPAAEAKQAAQSQARVAFSDMMQDLANAYDELDRIGGIPSSSRRSLGENVGASIAASGPGQMLSGAVATQGQTQRDIIKNLGFTLLNQIKNMEGIGARSLDSNVELKNALRSLGDPSQSIESVRATLRIISRVYKAQTGIDLGLGGGAPAPARGGGAPPPPAAIADLRRNPGTAKQFDEIFGAGAAAKALGR